ncbi:hypothetical protein EDB85DRAFT_1132138 [Lactarius pseudohatsudake]|nr:hypothetical protein EDB85DRAFT_1132138 [Lactarius pseudohatsudake]
MGNPDDWVVHSNGAFHPHPSSGSEERNYEEHHPGFAPYNPPNSFPPVGVQSYEPRGTLMSDCLNQYPQLEHFLIGAFYPGNPEVGHPVPVTQSIQAQATFPPIASGAPSGDSMPPGSFRAPPLHLACSPTPHTFLPYCPSPRRIMFSVPPRQVHFQPQLVTVSSTNPAGHPSHNTLVLRQNRTSAAQRSNAHPPSSKPSLPCPICGKTSRRKQERNRHLLSHLPCYISCSFDACPWRGDRKDTFRKHLYVDHQTPELGEHGYQLYNPWPLVDRIVEGSISIEDAKQFAIADVERMAFVFRKQEWLNDPCGRKGKKCSG